MLLVSLRRRFLIHKFTISACAPRGHYSMAVKEGSARVNLPEGVFYNPVQEFNRDVTVSVIRQFLKTHLKEFIAKGEQIAASAGRQEPTVYKGLAVLEALAASGLRSVRFANEIPLLQKIIANDMDPAATALIEENTKINNVEDIVTASCANAIMLMIEHAPKDKFNVIDLDPYGTASPFLDSAVQCLFDGGLLCVTCTDMAVLCGTAEGTAYGKYGGVAIKMAAQHEQGLRLLLHAIQQAASRHDKVIEPLLSLSIDFYARVFVRVRKGASSVKKMASRMALVYSCTGCQSFYMQRLASTKTKRAPLSSDAPATFTPALGPPVQGPICPDCGSPFVVAGPLWADELHSREFVGEMLGSLRRLKEDQQKPRADDADDYSHDLRTPDWLSLAPGLKTKLPHSVPGTLDRLLGMLTVAHEELPDCPFYFQTDKLCGTMRVPVPKITDIREQVFFSYYRRMMFRITTFYVRRSQAMSEQMAMKLCFQRHTHFDALSSIKTDAPMSFIWDVMCAWKRKYLEAIATVKRSPPSPKPIGDKSPDDVKIDKKWKNKKHPPSEAVLRVATAMMARPVNPKVDFSEHPECNPASRAEGLVRYQLNPLPNWGPKARAKSSKIEVDGDVDSPVSTQPDIKKQRTEGDQT